MFRKQLTVNINDLDLKISKLNMKLDELEDETEYELTLTKLEQLTTLRCKLSESRGLGSVKPLVVSGLFGLASVLTVLYYEDREIIITSKAFNMATSMFRGSK